MINPNFAHVAVAEFSTRQNQSRYDFLSELMEVLTSAPAPMTVTEIAQTVGQTYCDNHGITKNIDWYTPTVQRTTQNLRKLVCVGCVQRQEIKTGRIMFIQTHDGMKSIEEKKILFSLIGG